MKSLLPLILIVLVLTGAIVFTLTKSTLPKLITKQETVSPNELEVDSFTTPTPTASPSPKATPTATALVNSKLNPTPSVTIAVPTITIKKSLTEEPKVGTKGEDVKIVDVATNKVITTKTTKTTVCTPVYGAANTCTEHVVVDTGADEVIFFNFAGLSYLAGLVAFIKSKYA